MSAGDAALCREMAAVSLGASVSACKHAELARRQRLGEWAAMYETMARRDDLTASALRHYANHLDRQSARAAERDGDDQPAPDAGRRGEGVQHG